MTSETRQFKLNMMVFLSVRAILHDEDTFTDPEEYRPERYLKGGQLNTSVRQPEASAFGFGRRYYSILSRRMPRASTNPSPSLECVQGDFLVITHSSQLSRQHYMRSTSLPQLMKKVSADRSPAKWPQESYRKWISVYWTQPILHMLTPITCVMCIIRPNFIGTQSPSKSTSSQEVPRKQLLWRTQSPEIASYRRHSIYSS